MAVVSCSRAPSSDWADSVGSLKQEILRVLVIEPERFIKSSLAQVVGTVAKHELPEHRWPALLDFLSQIMTSESLQDKEVGGG